MTSVLKMLKWKGISFTNRFESLKHTISDISLAASFTDSVTQMMS